MAIFKGTNSVNSPGVCVGGSEEQVGRWVKGARGSVWFEGSGDQL